MAEARTHQEKLAWLEKWCSAHELTLDLEGECGFGRECVGVSDGMGGWVDYDTFDWDTMQRLPEQEGLAPGEDAPDAYHKHDCLAVLGRGEGAEAQLYAWVHRLAEAGVRIERNVPKNMPDFGSLFGQNTRTRVVL